MATKHQSNCYRNIRLKSGVTIPMKNYADLIMTDEENAKIERQARALYTWVRKIKHPEGYYQLFVA